MDNIFNIMRIIILGSGVIGALTLFGVKTGINVIAKRLEESYSLKLNKEMELYKKDINKELEKYKSNLDNKNYISKAKFDAEFRIYRELSKAYFEMIKIVSNLIPIFGYKIIDEEAKKKYDEEIYSKSSEATMNAQDALNSNAPFITEEIFNSYEEILSLCKMQLNAFARRWDLGIVGTQKEKENLSGDDYLRTEEISKKFGELNYSIRQYLKNIEVID